MAVCLAGTSANVVPGTVEGIADAVKKVLESQDASHAPQQLVTQLRQVTSLNGTPRCINSGKECQCSENVGGGMCMRHQGGNRFLMNE